MTIRTLALSFLIIMTMGAHAQGNSEALKSYDKAVMDKQVRALETIRSAPVMDRVAPLAGAIFAQQSCGIEDDGSFLREIVTIAEDTGNTPEAVFGMAYESSRLLSDFIKREGILSFCKHYSENRPAR